MWPFFGFQSRETHPTLPPHQPSLILKKAIALNIRKQEVLHLSNAIQFTFNRTTTQVLELNRPAFKSQISHLPALPAQTGH